MLNDVVNGERVSEGEKANTQKENDLYKLYIYSTEQNKYS